jgi:hypothetical protein
MEITEKRSTEEVKTILRAFLADLGIEIVNEDDQGPTWGFWVKFGNFPLIIQTQANVSYTIIVLHISVTNELAIKRLNQIYDTNDAKTAYELTCAFSTPHPPVFPVSSNGGG